MFIKMARKDLIENIVIPEGISVSQEGPGLSITGTKGSVERRFDSPLVKLSLKDKEIVFTAKSAGKKEKVMVFTYRAHLKNMFKGVQEGFTYKLKICSGHFPMNVSVSNNKLIIKNFLGEKVPREVKLKEGVEVKIEGNIIVVESTNKEVAGQVSADIEQKTRRPGFDKRIFQDGIYIIEKAGKEI